MKIESKYIPMNIINTIHILNNAGYEAYLVGGCVRDLLLGRTPYDYDMCTSATPSEMVELFKSLKYSINPKGLKFGTVTILKDGEEIEITTYRQEKDYKDGRRPDSIEFTPDIHKDLERRDFTINAMAYNPISGELIDDYNGQQDIKAKTIRCVGNADQRFSEDGLRILRALRFAIQFDFDIAANTFSAMQKNKSLLQNISKERITAELEKMLTNGHFIHKWFITCSDLVFEMIPELKECYQFQQNNKYHRHDVYQHMLYVTDFCKTDDFIIKLAALLHDIGKPSAYTVDEEGQGHFYGHPKISHEIVCEKVLPELRLTKEQSEMLKQLVLYHDMEIPQTEKAVRKLIVNFGTDFIDKWIILKAADIADHVEIATSNRKPLSLKIADFKVIYQNVLEKESCFKITDLAINGKDIMEIKSISTGKEVGNYLKLLFEKVLNEEINNTKENLVHYLQSITIDNNLDYEL